MPVQPMVNLPMEKPTRRKVWVLNRHLSKTYREEYRGSMIEVPPKEEKSILMDLITAEKFLGRPTMPQDFAPNGDEVSMGKPLYIKELTKDETEKYDPKAATWLNPDGIDTEKYRCTICGKLQDSDASLKDHLETFHPNYKPVTSRDALASA